jgi:hypothetical protein
MQHTLTIGTRYGDVLVTEEELPTVTTADLKRLAISRAELVRCFAEGKKLMKGYTDSDRVRPIADQARDGTWFVNVVRFSAHTDPLMRAGHKAS